MLAAVGSDTPLQILELGCGTGECSKTLAKAGHRVVGIDISPKAIQIAQQDLLDNNLEFVVGSVLDMPFPDSSFDVAVDAFCLHCLIGSDRERFFNEVRRVLTPAGKLIGCTMIGDPPASEQDRYDPVSRTLRIGDIPVRFFARESELYAELQSHFQVEEFKVTTSTAKTTGVCYIR
jgi:ubiquinone/menaquinone biosynthesis C-methylase UbiE